MSTELQKKKIISYCLSTSEGGLEFCVPRFALKLKNEGHDSIVICLKNSDIEKKSKAVGLQVIALSQNNILYKFFLIGKLVHKYQPDIIISHRSLELKISILFKIFNRKIKLVNFIHTIVRYSKKNSLHQFLYSKINEAGVKQHCKDLVARYDLTQEIKFYEHQNNISEYYKKFDIFVMPSHEETFG